MSTVKIRQRKDNLFDIANYVFLGLLSLTFILPFWIVVCTSLVSEMERISRGLLILYPQKIDWSAYKFVLNENSLVYSGYIVTVFRTVVGTICNMLVTSMLSYSLSKRIMPLKNLFTFMIFFTTLFNGGMVPNYLLIKYMGLIDNPMVYILPSMVSVWNFLVLRNFFKQIPGSFEEAAEIDGASPVKILFSIIIPLSLPAMVTIGLFYAVAHWNAWFDAMLYINNIKLMPLQKILRDIIVSASVSEMQQVDELPPPMESVKSATIMVATLPILFLYPFLQKYFVKGMIIGGIKG